MNNHENWGVSKSWKTLGKIQKISQSVEIRKIINENEAQNQGLTYTLMIKLFFPSCRKENEGKKKNVKIIDAGKLKMYLYSLKCERL